MEDVKYLTKTLGIKTELDIRSSGERANMKESPMGEGGPWEIKLSKNEDMSDARVWFMRAGTVDPATGREVASDGAVRDTFTFEAPRANLEIATKYYWCVSSDIVCRRHKYKKGCRCEHSRPSRGLPAPLAPGVRYCRKNRHDGRGNRSPSCRREHAGSGA